MGTEKKGRGGARVGAGLPSAGLEKRVTISARVTPETAAKFSECSSRTGMSLGRILDTLCLEIDNL